MASTFKIRNGLLIGLFVLGQFFWLLVGFAYSDTERGERPSRDSEAPAESTAAPAPAATVAQESPAGPSSPRSPTSPSSLSDGPDDPATPSTPASPTSVGPDLGSQIKYCIVFPLLNAAGEPIPTFDVPECPVGPPPPLGSPRLTVVKVVVNDDAGTATSSDFTLLVGSITVRSGVQRTFAAGSYVVSEATTTVTIGTTTQKYVPEFSGDCDSAGHVTLSAGDIKTCTILNDDEGPGGQGGDGDGGDGGDGDGGNGGDGDDGGDSNGGNGGNGGNGDGGGISGGRAGQVAGAVSPEPEFLGGADGIPGAPNAGGGGRSLDVLGMLLFSASSTLLAGFLTRVLSRHRFTPSCQV